jgi:hypothetical protein
MATNSSKGPLQAQRAATPKARAEASPLGHLVRLLARQAGAANSACVSKIQKEYNIILYQLIL